MQKKMAYYFFFPDDFGLRSRPVTFRKFQTKTATSIVARVTSLADDATVKHAEGRV